MKSLGEFNHSTECSQIRELLASRGIPTYWNPGFGGACAPLFVCIDEQYNDALALLKNPEHTVAHPVDVKEFTQAERTQGFGTILIGGGAILLLLLAVIGVWLAVHLHK